MDAANMVDRFWRPKRARDAVNRLRQRLYRDGYEFNLTESIDPCGLAKGYLDCKVCHLRNLTHSRALEYLSHQWGLDVSGEQADDQPLAGGLYVTTSGTQRWILVSETDLPVRKRWTLAHEIGHLVAEVIPRLEVARTTIGDLFPSTEPVQMLRFGRCRLSQNGPLTSKDKLELDANDFAAELLAPLDGIRKIMSTHHPNGFRTQVELGEFIGALQERFDISQEAAQRRVLDDLGIAVTASGPNRELFG